MNKLKPSARVEGERPQINRKDEIQEVATEQIQSYFNAQVRVDAMNNEDSIEIDATNNFNVDDNEDTRIDHKYIITDEKELEIMKLREMLAQQNAQIGNLLEDKNRLQRSIMQISIETSRASKQKAIERAMADMDDDTRKKLEQQVDRTCNFAKDFGFEFLVDDIYYDRNQIKKSLISPTDTFSKNTYLGDKKAYIVGCLWGASRHNDNPNLSVVNNQEYYSQQIKNRRYHMMREVISEDTLTEWIIKLGEGYRCPIKKSIKTQKQIMLGYKWSKKVQTLIEKAGEVPKANTEFTITEDIDMMLLEFVVVFPTVKIGFRLGGHMSLQIKNTQNKWQRIMIQDNEKELFAGEYLAWAMLDFSAYNDIMTQIPMRLQIYFDVNDLVKSGMYKGQNGEQLGVALKEMRAQYFDNERPELMKKGWDKRRILVEWDIKEHDLSLVKKAKAGLKAQQTRNENKLKQEGLTETQKKDLENSITENKLKIAAKDHIINGFRYQIIRQKVIYQLERSNKRLKLSEEDLQKKIKMEVAKKLEDIPLDDIPDQYRDDYESGLLLNKEAQEAEKELAAVEGEEEKKEQEPPKKRSKKAQEKTEEKEIKSVLKNKDEEILKDNQLVDQPPPENI